MHCIKEMYTACLVSSSCSLQSIGWMILLFPVVAYPPYISHIWRKACLCSREPTYGEWHCLILQEVWISPAITSLIWSQGNEVKEQNLVHQLWFLWLYLHNNVCCCGLVVPLICLYKQVASTEMKRQSHRVMILVTTSWSHIQRSTKAWDALYKYIPSIFALTSSTHLMWFLLSVQMIVVGPGWRIINTRDFCFC